MLSTWNRLRYVIYMNAYINRYNIEIITISFSFDAAFFESIVILWQNVFEMIQNIVNRSPIIINNFLPSFSNSFLLLLIKLSRALIFIFIFIQWKQETYLHVYICNFYCILYILHICKHICNIYQSVVNKLIGESSSKRLWN